MDPSKELNRKKTGNCTALVGAGSLMKGVFKGIEELYVCEQPTMFAVPSGFEGLDALIGGFYYGDIVVLCGGAGVGASVFCVNAGLSAASRLKIPTALFGLSSSPRQTGLRLLTVSAALETNRIARGLISREDWARLTNCSGRLADLPLYLGTGTITSAEGLVAAMRSAKTEQSGLRFVIVDGLQLILGPDETAAEAVRQIKLLGKELDVAVLVSGALCSADRESCASCPVLRYGDIVITLDRTGAQRDLAPTAEHFPSRDDTPAQVRARLTVVRNKNGSAGQTLDLTFHPEDGRCDESA